jgi:3-dehydroquinate synthase
VAHAVGGLRDTIRDNPNQPEESTGFLFHEAQPAAFAHAIERAENYRIRHGEAVAIGCCFIAEVARRTGGLDSDLVERHARAFGSVGLPTSYNGASFDELLATMRVDKKARGNLLRFVVLSDLAVPTVLEGPDEAVLREAFEAIGGGGG